MNWGRYGCIFCRFFQKFSIIFLPPTPFFFTSALTSFFNSLFPFFPSFSFFSLQHWRLFSFLFSIFIPSSSFSLQHWRLFAILILTNCFLITDNFISSTWLTRGNSPKVQRTVQPGGGTDVHGTDWNKKNTTVGKCGLSLLVPVLLGSWPCGLWSSSLPILKTLVMLLQLSLMKLCV
jgi:hypothetical protein